MQHVGEVNQEIRLKISREKERRALEDSISMIILIQKQGWRHVKCIEMSKFGFSRQTVDNEIELT